MMNFFCVPFDLPWRLTTNSLMPVRLASVRWAAPMTLRGVSSCFFIPSISRIRLLSWASLHDGGLWTRIFSEFSSTSDSTSDMLSATTVDHISTTFGSRTNAFNFLLRWSWSWIEKRDTLPTVIVRRDIISSGGLEISVKIVNSEKRNVQNLGKKCMNWKNKINST